MPTLCCQGNVHLMTFSVLQVNDLNLGLLSAVVMLSLNCN